MSKYKKQKNTVMPNNILPFLLFVRQNREGFTLWGKIGNPTFNA